MSKQAIYIESKIDGQSYCKTNGHFTKHLRKHNITYQQYYEKYVTGVEEKCPHCNNAKAFYQRNHSYADSCGNPVCVGKTLSNLKQNWSEEKKLSDSLNKRAAAALHDKAYYEKKKEKFKKTNKERYGVEYATQSDDFKEKSRKTKLEKYGNEYYSGWEKSADKNRNKTSEEQNIINDARRETNMKLFGVECSFLRPESMYKSRKSNALGKEYTLPSGKVVGIRGYENLVLDILFRSGYTENDIKFHNKLTKYELPIFDYISDQRQHLKYYPDIYIEKENKIIEVKSRWWWDGYGKEKYAGRLVNNQRKAESVINASYKYEVWLFENEKEYKIIQYG